MSCLHLLLQTDLPCATAIPPSGEYLDDQGRVYYYSSATGESSWSNPMEDVFRDCVKMYRRAMRDGGFWAVEDELERQEEEIKVG